MSTVDHLTLEQMESQLDTIRQSPSDEGVLELIVARPDIDHRVVLDEGELDLKVGLVGDSWLERGNPRRADGAADPESQLNIMNSRVTALLAREKSRWSLAGDQLYIDFDLSDDNLPPGAQLEIGTAVVEVTAEPHTGCAKFASRYGKDAMRFVNSPEGKRLHLRGINAKVIKPGPIRTGDMVRKL